jgi:hypothetical protein
MGAHVSATGVWIGRLLVSLVATVGVAYAVSFKVADYVVKAHTETSVAAFQALQGSIDTMNATLSANTTAIGDLGRQITALTETGAGQSGQLVALLGDVQKIKDAVQGAGIDIRAGMKLEDFLRPNSETWEAIKTKYGITGTAPVFLEIKPMKSLQ